MKTQDRLRPVHDEAPFRPSWADSLRDLSLDEARKKAKEKQSEITRARSWRVAALPASALSEFKCWGLFACRSDWDEPVGFGLPEKTITAYPRLKGEELCYHQASFEDLQPNLQWKVLEPPSSAPVLEPDVVFVPALFLDRYGHRIGRGAGYYDRYLSQRPNIRTIGVVHSDYLMDRIPDHWLHAGDQRVQTLLTESQFYSSTEETQS